MASPKGLFVSPVSRTGCAHSPTRK